MLGEGIRNTVAAACALMRVKPALATRLMQSAMRVFIVDSVVPDVNETTALMCSISAKTFCLMKVRRATSESGGFADSAMAQSQLSFLRASAGAWVGFRSALWGTPRMRIGSPMSACGIGVFWSGRVRCRGAGSATRFPRAEGWEVCACVFALNVR